MPSSQRRSVWIRLAVLALAWASVVGCQLIVDSEITQCQTDGDCLQLTGVPVCGPQGVCIPEANAGDGDGDGAAALPRWACIDGEPPPESSDEIVQIRFSVFNYGTFTVPEGVTVKVCNAFDVLCTEPLQEGLTLDADGFVTIDLPANLVGYFEIKGDTIVDSLLYRNRPFEGDETFEGPAVVTPQIQDSLAMGGGESIDPTQGTIIMDIKDCDGNAAAGVKFWQEDTESEETPFYFETALPDRDLPSTAESTMLTSDGTPRSAGGFSMVDQGYVTVYGTLEDGGARVGKQTVIVRPGSMTFAQIFAGY